MSTKDPTNPTRQTRRRRNIQNGIAMVPNVPLTLDVIEMMTQGDIPWLQEEMSEDRDYVGKVVGAMLHEAAMNWKSRR
jgi:hypothetical protein